MIVPCTPADRHRKQLCESYCFSQVCRIWYLDIVSQNFLRWFDQFPLNAKLFLQLPFRKRYCIKSPWLNIRSVVTGRTPARGGFDRITLVGKIPILLHNLISYSIYFILGHMQNPFAHWPSRIIICWKQLIFTKLIDLVVLIVIC